MGIKKIIGLVLCMVILAGSAQAAGWVDDWFTQAATTSPSSYTGQQRGYLTGGGISVRYSHTTTYPITATAPSFNVGCGGIDLFAGGFSFLNSNYLVNTMQNMVSAAPAVAFDLAMKTLCPSCSSTLKALKAVTDRLNSVQLNGCKTTKAVITMAADTLTGKTEGAQSELTKLATDTGLYSLYKDSKDALATGNATTVTSTTKADVTGGNLDLDALLYQKGSYLEKAVNATSFASTTWNANLTDIARGYVGDFYTAVADNLDSTRPISPCSNNNWNKIWKDLMDGKVEARPAGGASCKPITDLKKNMNTYTQTMMTSIVTKMRDPANAFLTPEEEMFVRTVPFPVFTHMKMAASESPAMVNAYIKDVNNIVAEAFSVNIMINLFEETEKMLVHYKELITNKKKNTVKKAGEGSVDKALGNVETLRKRLHAMNTDILMKHIMLLRLNYETATKDLRNRSDTFDRVVAGVLSIPEE